MQHDLGWRFAKHTARRTSLILAAVTACLAGTTSIAHAVVGGALVRSSDQARHFTVKIESSKGELCSGVALEPRIILTAAHCVIGGGSFQVSALDHQMRRRNIRVARIVAHESFLPGHTPSTQPGVDLAVLRLAEPLPAGIQPVVLGGSVGLGDALMIAGFGLGQEGQRQTARTLRQSILMSAGSYSSGNSVVVAVDNQTLGQASGAGACKGDSGGPIMRGGPSSTELVGIVSWSSGPSNQRARRVCGGFTAITPVSDHRGWINSAARALAAAPDEALAPTRPRGTRAQTAAPPRAAVIEPRYRPDPAS